MAQIDVHHGGTLLAALSAGIEPESARKIAVSAQFVDDNVPGAVSIRGMSTEPIVTAHSWMDYADWTAMADEAGLWKRFHFFPADGTLVTRPDSEPLNELIARTVPEADEFRLGILLHVVADSHFHQGFSGVQSELNAARDMDLESGDHGFFARIEEFFSEMEQDAGGLIIGEAMPLGHACLLSWADLPHAKFFYTDGNDRTVYRDNKKLTLRAVQKMASVCRDWRGANADDDVAEILPKAVNGLIGDPRDPRTSSKDRSDRHCAWLDTIHDMFQDFAPDYVPWSEDTPDEWLSFRAAARAHRDLCSDIFEARGLGD
jgi:hypothetical protein